MAAFIHMISIWPISISIAENLSFGDLLNLSRLSSECRCALHGFPFIPALKSVPSGKTVRPDLYIGQHQTSYWQGLKQVSLQQCSERNHTQGSAPQCCRRCSMPVCEACIVKENYKKNEPTFKNRCRHLCIDCWTSGTPHVGRHTTGPPSEFTLSYNFAPGNGDFCICTVRDGWLCTSCKNEQNLEAKNTSICAGEGCGNSLEEDKESRRICLWCDLPLIKRQHRSENRDPKKEYNFGYSFEGRVVEEDSPVRHVAAWRKHHDTSSQAVSYDKGCARLANIERRRIDRLLQPDETVPQYIQLGARRQRRKKVLESTHGVLKYDRDFPMQFKNIRTNELPEDWPGMMKKLMVGEEGDPDDGFARDGEVKGRKRKTNEDEDEEEDVESSVRGYRNGKKKEMSENCIAKETGSLQAPFCRRDEDLLEREGLPSPERFDDEYFVVRKIGLSDPLEGNEGQRDRDFEGSRVNVGPSERPPDYNMCGNDLLLDLDGFLNGN